jgi:cystathionine beta-lyase/cystathionine gamma-synthase
MKPATRAVQGRKVRLDQTPVAPPIHPAASYEADPETLSAILDRAQPGFAYGRYGNPTAAACEEAVANLEGAEAAVWCATGTGAMLATLAACCSAGDEVICATAIYGGTRALLEKVVARWGVTVTLAPHGSLTPTPRTRAIVVESIANPALEVPDLPAIAARKGDALLIVDNTFATPILCQPLRWGADVVVHSATKYLGGHGDVIAGVAVASLARIEPIRAMAVTMGVTGDPWGAWLVMRGLQTLPLRMERHCANARVVATWLRERGLPMRRAVATPWLVDGGGIVAVDLPSREAALAVMRRLRLFRVATSLGDCHSMVLHPASTSHRGLDEAGLAGAGVTPGTLRLSVGIEDVDDLVEDLRQALEA